MGIITRFKRAANELRGNPNNPLHWPGLTKYLTLSASGQVVDPDTAMSQSAVFACVKIISETLASLPVFLYRRKPDGSRAPATNKTLFNVLHDQPNPVWSSFEFYEYLTSSVELRGNGFCWREVNNAGQIIALWPLDTNGMTWEVGINSKGARRITKYIYTYPSTIGAASITFSPDEIWHIKDAIGPDGVSGQSRITQAATTIGLSLSADEYGSKFFANDATPSGLLVTPGILQEDARKHMKESWNEIHQGSENAFKAALMEGGVTYEPMSMNNEDAQFIQTRSFQVADVCRIFRVPTIMVGGAGEADKSNTFASAEQQMLSFSQNTVRPWAVRFERNMSSNLLDEKERKSLFVEFKLEGLLRGDFKTRMEGYKIGREIGLYSVDEIRNIENLDPLGEAAGGQDHIMPMNFKKLNEESETETETEPVQEELPMEDDSGE